jgi:hypothetical protein
MTHRNQLPGGDSRIELGAVVVPLQQNTLIVEKRRIDGWNGRQLTQKEFNLAQR